MPPPVIEVTRALTVEDLASKAVRRVSTLDRVRNIHHMQAKLIALGKAPTAVSAALGTSVVGLNSLLEDPMFQELVQYYASQVEEIVMSNAEKAGVVGRLALDQLQERLETERVATRDLIQITETLGDRSDFAKRSTSAIPIGSNVITFNFGTLPDKQKTIEAESND
jgi:hypothetical protein